MTGKRDFVETETPNKPGKTYRVDAAKYEAMRHALLKLLPTKAPGLSYAEMLDSITPLLPEELFPGGEKRGWWLKTVQLDLEAKNLISRANTKPLRWYRRD